MVPALLIGVGCVLMVAFVSAAVILWSRLRVHVSTDSEDENEEVEMEGGLRAVKETAALIDITSESRPQSAPKRSILMVIADIFSGKQKKNGRHAKKLMQRRRKGAKKIHKPYFYPLLDETAQWFADWESKKLQEVQSTAEEATETAHHINCRIDKLEASSSSPTPSTLYPRDLLDMPFRSSSHHTVIPVAAI